ncbi:MAG: hypothetical protein J7K23_02775 [Thermoproteales archaeon]|nr:hypothetical protein [Thermoproteales archaeon]
MIPWHILYALNRSRVKREILEFLAFYPNKIFTLSEIAKYTNNYLSTVHGALHGLKGHYKNDLALISLGLVEMIQCNNRIKGYRITGFGIRVIKTIATSYRRKFSLYNI